MLASEWKSGMSPGPEPGLESALELAVEVSPEDLESSPRQENRVEFCELFLPERLALAYSTPDEPTLDAHSGRSPARWKSVLRCSRY